MPEYPLLLNVFDTEEDNLFMIYLSAPLYDALSESIADMHFSLSEYLRFFFAKAFSERYSFLLDEFERGIL